MGHAPTDRTTHDPIAFIRTGETTAMLSVLGYHHIPVSHGLDRRQPFTQAARLLAADGLQLTGEWLETVTGWQAPIEMIPALQPA